MSKSKDKIRIPVAGESGRHDGHTVREVVLDKQAHGLYCGTCKRIISYSFAQEQAPAIGEWLKAQAPRFEECAEQRVDQMPDFIKLTVTSVDKSFSAVCAPTGDSYILKDEAGDTGLRRLFDAAEEIPFEEFSKQISESNEYMAFTAQPDPDASVRPIVVDDCKGIVCITQKSKDKIAVIGYAFDVEKMTPEQCDLWLVEKDFGDVEAAPASDVIAKRKAEEDEADPVELLKVDKEKRIVYGVFLVPEKADWHGDVISAEDIEKVAHQFVSLYQKGIDEMHGSFTINAEIVESFIAWKNGITYYGKKLIKGTWAGAIKVYDDAVWEKILSGEYKAFSVRISGVRTPIEDDAASA